MGVGDPQLFVNAPAREQLIAAERARLHIAAEDVQLAFLYTAVTAGCALYHSFPPLLHFAGYVVRHATGFPDSGARGRAPSLAPRASDSHSLPLTLTTSSACRQNSL